MTWLMTDTRSTANQFFSASNELIERRCVQRIAKCCLSMTKQTMLCLIILAIPTLAEAQELFPWADTTSSHFAKAPEEAENQEQHCQSRVDGGERRRCIDNRSSEPSSPSAYRLSLLDRLLLAVDSRRRVTFDEGFQTGTKLNFEIERVSVSNLAADVKLTLKIEF